MHTFDLPASYTIIVSILVMFLGEWLTRRVSLLSRLNIPEPVTGGILAAVALAGLDACGIKVAFHENLRDGLLIVFFAIIGLSARLSVLRAGGLPLVLLILVAMFVVVFQDVIGCSMAWALGLDARMGLIAGSISMSGGHGTAIAWSKTYTELGIPGALEAGIACATLGLVAGGLVGGPLGRRFIDRYKLTPEEVDKIGAENSVGQDYRAEESSYTYRSVMNGLLLLTCVVALGIFVQRLLSSAGITVPAFLPCIMIGILATNILPGAFPRVNPWPGNGPFMALVCQGCLNLFLVISMMSIRLSSLIDLAGPILLIGLTQIAFIAVIVSPFVFRILGKSYDASVMTAGYAGLALGATPTAIANMTSLTHRFGPSPRSFIVIPLVGTCFVDVVNALVVNIALAILG